MCMSMVTWVLLNISVMCNQSDYFVICGFLCTQLMVCNFHGSLYLVLFYRVIIFNGRRKPSHFIANIFFSLENHAPYQPITKIQGNRQAVAYRGVGVNPPPPPKFRS